MSTEVSFLSKTKANISDMNVSRRKLLVLDTSYSYEAISKRRLHESVTCRDLDGFFDHVWSVHPFSTLVTSDEWASKYGKPEVYEMAAKHTFIEGKIGRYKWLSWFPLLNFIIGQLSISIYLRRLIKAENISVIRAGDMLYLGLLGLALCRLCKIPLVIRVGGNHDKIYETTGQPIQKRLFFNRKVEKAVERFVLKRADLVAGANKDNLNFALANGARKQYSTIFRYGNLIHSLHFSDPGTRDGTQILKELGVEKNKFLLYIGRLEKVKQPDHVIRALAEIRNRGIDFKAVLVGDGRMLNELREFCKQLSLFDQVIFCGNKDQEWLSRIIPNAGVIISPHTGRALAEAALGQIPIVAYDIDWQAELIETGVTGELVPYSDYHKMAASIERFVKDPSYAQKMAIALRLRTIQMMSPEILNEHERNQYLSLFDRFNGKHFQFRK
jgi:glycosyltransferase involved in cell wall biosynthesis